MKQVILFLFLTIASLSIAQDIEPCSGGMLFFSRTNNLINISLVKNGEILPARFKSENKVYSTLFSYFKHIESKEYPNTIQYNTVNSKLINSKAKITLCYESFKEQFLPFALGEVNELTLISQKGIPFLTFTRLE